MLNCKKVILWIISITVLIWNIGAIACPKESRIFGGDKGEWLPFSESCFNSEELEGRWQINTDSEALFLEIKFEESIQSVGWYSVKLLNDQNELQAYGLLPFRKGVFKGVLSTIQARSIPVRFYKYNGRNPGEQFYKLIMKWPKEGHREKEFVPQKSSLVINSSTHNLVENIKNDARRFFYA